MHLAGLDTNFLDLLGDYVVEGCSPRASSNKRSVLRSRIIQPMQRLVYLVPNGGVEFLQEIEPRLGDVTKNLSAVIGGAFPAHELLPPADPASGLYPVPVRSSSLRCPVSEAPQACASQDAQDVVLLRGDAMLIEHGEQKRPK